MERKEQLLTADTQFGFLDKATDAHEVYNSVLISNEEENTMRRAIKSELRRSESFKFSVAFVTPGALAMLKQDLLDFEGTGTIITSDYLGFNEPEMFRELFRLPDNISVHVHADGDRGFHSKGYLFDQGTAMTAIVGSSNLTRAAMLKNQEWNLRFSALPNGDIVDQLGKAIDQQLADSEPLTEEWIQRYEQRRVLPPKTLLHPDQGVIPAKDFIQPNSMQVDALERIDDLREQGEERALVISATGTGKTILGALAVRNAAPDKFLFIVHSEQILNRAIEEFQKVLGVGDDQVGLFTGHSKDLSKKYTFATNLSIARPDTLTGLDPELFDFILIDEVHRAGADSYRRIIDHFTPEFLLGLTATPERSDGIDVYELFHHNLAYEIRLQKALEADMLVPFDYFGVTDYVDASGATIDDNLKDLAHLVAPERVRHIMRMLWMYGFPSDVKGLIFCSSTEEAKELSTLLNEQELNGQKLRTVALTGADSIETRDHTVARLEAGELDYILTVNIFNEGIDIRSINQIVMLRSTESSIIFTQQLGRGLRKCAGKGHLRVIDFIGNYKNNFLIPIALFGNNSLNKDSVRKQMIEAEASGAIAGLSNVNFDRIARERVFEALAQTKLDSAANLRKAVRELQQRLGTVPTRMDFARFETADPVVLARKTSEHITKYWGFLARNKFVDVGPNSAQDKYLHFLDRFILPSKRAAEVLLLELLLTKGSCTKEDCKQYLLSQRADPQQRNWAAQGANSSRQFWQGQEEHLLDLVIDTALRVLTTEFFPEQYKNFFGAITLASVEGDQVSLAEGFVEQLENDATFRSHVDDVVEATKYLVRQKHSWAGGFVLNARYSRDDVCRLLNFEKLIISQNMGGYYMERRGEVPQVCPIFITYHKDEDISATVKYEDEFLDAKTLKWFTKNNRTPESKTERQIIDNLAPLPVFVKKDDVEGTDFFYLGESSARDAKKTTMLNDKMKEVDVAYMKLDLEVEVERSLYDYFLASSE